MHIYTTAQILEKIRKEECFSCIAHDGSFSLAIEEYVPYICAAIHEGHQLREDLEEKILLSSFERWQEEDPHTEEFITSLPMRIVGKDSRYEYDLNRSPDECIYNEAWGKKVWKRPLSKKQRELSLRKHHNFYTVMHALVAKIEEKFGSCVVYDIHSYNYKRIKGNPPLFNIGSQRIERKKFFYYIELWKSELSKIVLPSTENSTKINDVFFGKGYLLESVMGAFRNTLVLATEVKKVFCNEETQEIYPDMILEIRHGLKKAILNHASRFIREKTTKKIRKKYELLTDFLEPATVKVDQGVSTIVGQVPFLEYINPTNVESEKRAFFASKYRRNPQFRYLPASCDLSRLKESLYRLPVTAIDDPTVQKMYRKVIDGQAEILDMLSLRGEPKFLYSSLKYFGEPTKEDEENALFLLRCRSFPLVEEKMKMLSSSEVVDFLQKVVSEYGFRCKVELTSKIPSRALFYPTKRLLKIKKSEKFTLLEAQALGHHEIGIHMVTTANAAIQPLRILRIGFPRYTLTQEGMAILSEYLSGTLDVRRLHILALRVLAVKHMLRNQDFTETFHYLMAWGLTKDEAYYLSVRVHRGGGFTKDYVYLKGFCEVLRYFESNRSMAPLLLGKTCLHYLPILEELIGRDILQPPQYFTKSYINSVKPHPIIQYIVHSLRL